MLAMHIVGHESAMSHVNLYDKIAYVSRKQFFGKVLITNY